MLNEIARLSPSLKSILGPIPMIVFTHYIYVIANQIKIIVLFQIKIIVLFQNSQWFILSAIIILKKIVDPLSMQSAQCEWYFYSYPNKRV